MAFDPSDCVEVYETTTSWEKIAPLRQRWVLLDERFASVGGLPDEPGWPDDGRGLSLAPGHGGRVRQPAGGRCVVDVELILGEADTPRRSECLGRS